MNSDLQEYLKTYQIEFREKYEQYGIYNKEAYKRAYQVELEKNAETYFVHKNALLSELDLLELAGLAEYLIDTKRSFWKKNIYMACETNYLQYVVDEVAGFPTTDDENHIYFEMGLENTPYILQFLVVRNIHQPYLDGSFEIQYYWFLKDKDGK